jgi:hypothetical protein
VLLLEGLCGESKLSNRVYFHLSLELLYPLILIYFKSVCRNFF